MAQINIDYKGCLIIVAIGLSFVAIGAIADLLVRKREIKWLHGRFLKLSEALTEIPLREWQVKIAKGGISFYEKILKVTTAFWTAMVNVLSLKLPLSIINIAKKKLSLKRLLIFSMSTSCALYLGGPWFFGAVFLPVMVALLCLILEFIYFFDTAPFLKSSILSAILSIIATFMALYLVPSALLNSFWYDGYTDRIVPRFPLMLPSINYLFDFATIIVSILLLRFVIKHKCFIGFVAVVDIIISAVLTVMLYCFLLVIENKWDILHLHVYFADSLHWFRDVIVGIYQAAKYNEPFTKHLAGLKDIHLLPILLTTFVPVALYMSVFVLISFCKPVLKLASRIFGAVGEREESVFKQFGFLIAAIMAAVKAVYEVLTL